MPAKKISILHVTTSLSFNSGVEETIRVLCRHLDPRHFRLGICSITDSCEDILPEFKQMDVELFGMDRKGYFFDLLTTLALRRVIHDFGADIVHTHRNKANLHGRVAALLNHTPSVTTYHDMGHVAFSRSASLKNRQGYDITGVADDHRPNLINSFIHPLLAMSFNCFTDRVIGVSETVRSVYTDDADDSRYVAVHAPYDEEIFSPHFQVLQKNTITLGSVGRLVAPKGYLYLIEAVRMLREKGRDVRLKIKGEGKMRPVLERSIAENNLEQFVVLCGDQSHDSTLYEDIDIYVQPSVSEGCSITLLEAMGSGIPVIACNIDGPRELIISAQHGLLVPPRDPEAIAAAVAKLLDDRQVASLLARAGQKRAHDQFSSQQFIQKMEKVYREVSNAD